MKIGKIISQDTKSLLIAKFGIAKEINKKVGYEKYSKNFRDRINQEMSKIWNIN